MSDGKPGKAASWPIYLFAALILIILAVVVRQVDDRLINQSQQEMGRELSAVLKTTEGSINQWFRDQRETAATWSEHGEVKSAILNLLTVELDSESLSASPNQWKGCRGSAYILQQVSCLRDHILRMLAGKLPVRKYRVF
jgi:hypothetical protein